MVTWSLPSSRVIVPRVPVTPAPAVTSSSMLTVSGGQLSAQPPVHALVVPESFPNTYRDLPALPVRYLPSVALVARFRVVPAGAWVAGAGVDAAVVGAAVGAGVGAGVAPPPPAHAAKRAALAPSRPSRRLVR